MASLSGFQRAVALYRQGQLELAEQQCRGALKRDPRNANGLQLLGVIQFLRSQPEEAIATFDRMLRLEPARPDALMHRGLALQQLHRLDEALASVDKALKIRPGYAEGLNNRSTILKDLGRLDEALESVDRSLAIAPDAIAALCNRGAVLRGLERYDEALASFDRALQLQPTSREALNLRGRLLYFLRRHEEAAQSFQQLLKVDPGRRYLRGLVFEVKLAVCDWTDFDATVADISARVDRGEPAEHPFNFTWYSLSPASQLRCTETFAAREWPAPRKSLPPCPRYAHDRIRLAYFSPDFREHPISYVFAGLIERHDRRRFEVAAVSFGASDGSSMRARLERSFDRFHDVRTMADFKVAELIRKEEIDIIVDLAGFTASNRGAVLAYRPAPVQVNFQGFDTAASFIDYVISDRENTPDRLAAFYREKIVWMPHSWMITDNTERIAEITPSRAEQGLPDRGFVFCAFNRANKIMPAMFHAWMRLLRAVEGSVLWLRYDNDAACTNLQLAAEAAGVAGHRLVFARRIGLPEHLARHRLADLFLDTFPYGAHTTASHAMWAGLPVLTMRGETFVSRVGSSLLQAIGLPELIVDSLSDYEALALRLAQNPTELAELRQKLMRQRTTAPLFDSERYARHIESAYQTMIERHRAGLAPASFDVPP